MKNSIFLFLCVLLASVSFGQIQKEHILSVLVNGVEYKAQPQQIRVGGYRYITANTIKPDRSLRIWIGGWDGGIINKPGKYLIVNGEKPDTKENFKKAEDYGNLDGIVALKWINEVVTPRMQFHVGYSENNNETMDVKVGDDGYLELSFNCILQGTYWKEKTSATVFGGLGRIVDKMEDKAVTSATGLDQDIDPEGNGYKKQKTTDKIELKNGLVKLKLKKEQ